MDFTVHTHTHTHTHTQTLPVFKQIWYKQVACRSNLTCRKYSLSCLGWIGLDWIIWHGCVIAFQLIGVRLWLGIYSNSQSEQQLDCSSLCPRLSQLVRRLMVILRPLPACLQTTRKKHNYEFHVARGSILCVVQCVMYNVQSGQEIVTLLYQRIRKLKYYLKAIKGYLHSWNLQVTY